MYGCIDDNLRGELKLMEMLRPEGELSSLY